MQVSHITSLEWHGAEKHRIKNNTGAPDVTGKVFVAFIFEHFRRDISWCAALLCHFFAWFNKLRNSKVADFNVAT